MRGIALVLVLLALLVAGCSSVPREPTAPDPPQASVSPSPSIRTLQALPKVEEPPTGRLTARMQQSSLDVSLGQFTVVLTNGTGREVDPISIRLDDPRLRAPAVGGRLRPDPALSARGYPFPLPRDPDCDGPRAQQTAYLLVEHTGRRERVEVDDETDVIGRFLATRCVELALAETAALTWSDDVPVDRPGAGAIGTLSLMVAPTGVPGLDLTIDEVAGSHLIGSAEDPPVWAPGVRITSEEPETRIDLPIAPSRCDDHAFVEGGNATAFRVTFTLDGTPGQVLLRMSPTGGRNAVRFARESCGYDVE